MNSSKFKIILCDSDLILGDIISEALEAACYKLKRFNSEGEELLRELSRHSGDVLIANVGSRLKSYLPILKYCREEFPQQKLVLVLSNSEEVEYGKLAEYADAVILKPFAVNDLLNTVQSLIGIAAAESRSWKTLLSARLKHVWFVLRKKIKELIKYRPHLIQDWRMSQIEEARSLALEKAYLFFRSKSALKAAALEIWQRLEFLERRYLLARGGVEVEWEALKTYYNILQSQLATGLETGRTPHVGGGDGLSPLLTLASFSSFYQRVRDGVISLPQFRKAAEVRLVHCASQAHAESQLQKNWEVLAQRRNTWNGRYLHSFLPSLDSIKAELRVLAQLKLDSPVLYSQIWY
ncbi:MAG: hypothetical protein K6A35_00815 [bacterium]|nr:hypothetical protein [bacterium]